MGGERKDNPTIQNRGVNITSDSLPVSAERNVTGEITDASEPLTVRYLRNHVQAVIEQMGPGTPQLMQNTSSEADNEESVYESTSLFSSVYKVKQTTKPKQESEAKPYSTDNSARDYSELSALVSSEVQPSTYSTVDQKDSETEQYYCQCSRNSNPVPVVISPPPPPIAKDCACQNCNHYGCGYQQTVPVQREYSRSRRSSFEQTKQMLSDWIQRSVRRKSKEPLELYKINITQPTDDHSPPRKLVFDLIDDIPKPETNTIGTNTKPLKLTKRGCPENCACGKKRRSSFENNSKDSPHKRGLHDHDISRSGTVAAKDSSTTNAGYCMDGKGATRVDVYYFDHGNAGYYRTTDAPPVIMTEILAERTENYTTRFWAELFGTIHIGFAFCTSFILQLVRFILYSLFRPLIVGLIQLTSDYFFKPFLAVIFNAILQPPLIFLFNILTSLRDLCAPIAEGIGYFLREIAVVLRAIRLVEVRNGNKYCYARKKHECSYKDELKCICPEEEGDIEKNVDYDIKDEDDEKELIE